jgi:hypothetical protein
MGAGRDREAFGSEQEAYAFAYEKLSRRFDPDDVARQLVKRGVAEADAAVLIDQARVSVAAARRSLGFGTLGIGVLIAGAGVVMTLSSWSKAHANPEGGRFTIWYGAVVAGILSIVRGLDLVFRPAFRAPPGRSRPPRRSGGEVPERATERRPRSR